MSTGSFSSREEKRPHHSLRQKHLSPGRGVCSIGSAGIYPGRVVAFGIWNEEMGTQDLFVLAERQDGNAPTPLKIAIQKAVMEEVGIVPKRVEILEHMSLVKRAAGR